MIKENSPWRSVVLVLLLLPLFSLSQTSFRVTGQVHDDAGKPVIGATVTIKGSVTATTTDQDGRFTIDAPSGKSTLVITSVGYEDQQIDVRDRTSLTIALVSSQKVLQNVVVIGYGAQKKGAVTGAVSVLKNDNFNERAIVRVDQALVGQLSGVTIKQNTGVPGKAFSIQIRGSGSISGGTEPLYVLDGFPLAQNSSNTGNGTFSTGNPLDNINPNDIESIQVLKDAAAAAIYGSRAANGVVLITTKRGQIGKPKINLNMYAGYNQASKKLEMMNGDQWIEQATEVINAQYVAAYPGASASDDRATRLARMGGVVNVNYILDPRWTTPGHPGLAYIDWQDEIERKGPIQNYEISASGGTDAVRYFMSGNYANQQSFIMNVGYQAYSARGNIELNPSKNLKLGLNIAPTYSITQDPGVDGKDAIFHQALSLAPVQEDTMGLFPNIGSNGQYAYSSTTNSPFGKLTYNRGTTKRFRTLGTIFGEWQIIKGLSFRTSVNFDNTDNITTTYVPYITQNTQSTRTFTGSNNLLAATSGTYNSYRRQVFVNENTLTYNTTFKEDHNLSVLAGYSYNTERLDRTTLSSNGGFTSAVIQTLNAAAAVTGNTNSTKNVLISWFSRLQYSYKEKYLLLASLRRDGSSKVGANNYYQNFPGVSLGWRISQENFMKSFDFLSELKIRVGYGVSGNLPPADYSAIATLGSYGYVFGTTPGAVIGQAPNVLANPNLKWEQSQTYNAGIDFGILRNRITGAFDVYNKTNTQLILNTPVPEATGFQSVVTNVGEVRNIGQELEVTSRNMTGRLEWTTSITFTHNTNKIIKLGPGQQQIIVPNGFNVSDAILRVGQPINSIYVLKVLGFLTQDDLNKNVARYGTGETVGDFKFQDTNGDGVITEADKVIVGHPNPDYTYGMTNTFRYKNFDLNFLIQGQSGGSIYSELGRAISRPGQGRSDNHPASFVDRWRSPTDQGDGRFSKAYSTYNSPIAAATDWLYSSDYIRVRNITLGYNLKGVVKTNAIQSIRIYITLENFFGHDKYYNGLNPEAANTAVSSNGAYPQAGDYGGLPLPKSLIGGINVNF
jgi:TonB-linked SusC/RagA family outer membrane protein